MKATASIRKTIFIDFGAPGRSFGPFQVGDSWNGCTKLTDESGRELIVYGLPSAPRADIFEALFPIINDGGSAPTIDQTDRYQVEVIGGNRVLVALIHNAVNGGGA